MQDIQISIIIVSYNVRWYLSNALASVLCAVDGLTHEIIVIDNASTDGSVEMLRDRFTMVRLITNQTNVGFAAANNQGLSLAGGKYIVLLNPDTLVQEDSFSSLMQFMDTHPRAGIATCKILNADGGFSVDSRHSIPSPMTAFWKQIGLSRLFPNSRRFARYNLTFLDENEIHRVDAISGSFMFLRAETVQQVGKLDEDYFMYCEDVDYCYRVGRAGWDIYYLPVTAIIHYKGESTRKENYRYAINFNRSLYLFYDKHFHEKYFPVLKAFILAGVFMRGLLIYLKNLIRSSITNSFTKIRVQKKAGNSSQALLVCAWSEAAQLIRKIRAQGYNLYGLVTLSEAELGKEIEKTRIIMTLAGITDKKMLKRVDDIIFSAKKISYKQIITAIAHPQLRKKKCLIIPVQADLLIGKDKIIYLE